VQNMTTLNSPSSRRRPSVVAGDGGDLSRARHDGNISPWLELAQYQGPSLSSFAKSTRAVRLDLDHLRSLLSDPARLAFPWASNASDGDAVAEVAALAPRGGALAGRRGDYRAARADLVAASGRCAPLLPVQVLRPRPWGSPTSGGAGLGGGGLQGSSRSRGARRRQLRERDAGHELLEGFVRPSSNRP